MPSLFLALVLFLIQQPAKKIDHAVRANQTDTNSQSANQATPSRTPSQIIVNQHDAEPKKEEKRNFHIDSVSTAVIAVFTILTFFVYREQLRATKISGRAWVTFLLPEETLIEKTRGGRPDGYQIGGCIKNIGNTPATIVRKFHFTSILDKTNGEQLDTVPPYLTTAEKQTEYQMIPESLEFTLDEISEFHRLNITKFDIYVFGQIVYKDVFGRVHETRYCLRYFPQPTVGRRAGFYPEGPSAYLKVT